MSTVSRRVAAPHPRRSRWTLAAASPAATSLLAWTRLALAAAVVSTAFSISAQAQEPIFSEDFEGGDLAGWASFAPPDTALPQLTLEPGDGAVVATETPEIILSFRDPQAGIEAASLAVSLDGTDLLPACQLEAFRAVCAPPAPLSAGPHVLEASIRDRAGQITQADSTFTVDLEDSTPPELAIAEPMAPIIAQAAPRLVLTYADAGSGVDLTSLTVEVDTLDVTVTCTVDPGLAVCLSPVLEPGAHRIRATVADLAGNGTEALFDFTVDLSSTDADPPQVLIESPPAELINPEQVSLLAVFGDDGSGPELGSLEVTLDGAPVTGCDVGPDSLSCPLAAAAGDHVVGVGLEDRAGNRVLEQRAFTVIEDTTPPEIERLSPQGPAADGPSPLIVLALRDTETAIDPESFTFEIDGRILTGDCTITLADATCATTLAPGTHTFIARVADRAGNAAELSFELDVRLPPVDRTPPAIAFLAPGPELIGAATASIELTFSDDVAVDPASLAVSVGGADVSASCQIEAGDATCASPNLPRGVHRFAAAVADTSGNVGSAFLDVTVNPALTVAIASPGPLEVTQDSSLEIVGSVDPPADVVRVGPETATLEGASFRATVQLVEGSNTITATATTGGGGVGTATRTIVRDTTAPRVRIRTPSPGLVTSSPQIAVTGDALDSASSNAVLAPLAVTVNGVPAQVENDAFVLFDVLLQPGENHLEVRALDAAGNEGLATVTVTRIGEDVGRLEELLGNGQEAGVGEELARPLVVRVVDGLGRPLESRDVRFTVSRGDGLLLSGEETLRRADVRTDENGLARLRFRLGTRAGAGVHEVEVESAGLPGKVIFCASAAAGAPARIQAILGDNAVPEQRGAAGRPLPKPLLAQVFDASGNPVPGAEVTFEIVKGTGSFEGADFFVAVTDDEGKASAELTLGEAVSGDPEAVSDVVEAYFDGLTEPPALFLASALEPTATGDTELAGLVLDNQDVPVPGVTVHLEGTAVSAITDAGGAFLLTGVPVGTITLEVDGTTTPLPGEWPHLAFKLTTVSGARNDLGMPIRLLPLDTEGGRLVGGSEDVTLKLDGVPGAELTVFADSVTFPDGSTEGVVTFTQVHSDKVPMQPPMGSGFMLAWTVQPTDAHFDPPARIAIPNSGLPAGSVVDIFSFDHDLGEFLPIGTATVSEDGSQIVSDPGVGVIKAGWHGCVPPPPPRGDACSAGTCSSCDPASRRPVPLCEDDCERCGPDGCEPKEIEEVEVLGENVPDLVVADVGDTLDFEAKVQGGCGEPTYDWSFPGAAPASKVAQALQGVGAVAGAMATGGSPMESRTYPQKGKFTAEVEVACPECPQIQPKTGEIDVVIVDVDLFMQGLDEEDQAGDHEEMPGAWVPLNPTRNNPQAGDPQSVPVLLTIDIPDEANLSEGEAKLELSQGSGRLRVYRDAQLNDEIQLPKTWDLEDPDFPVETTLYVEGITVSQAIRDAELTLSFSSGGSEADDKVAVTVGELRFIRDDNSPIPASGAGAYVGISHFKTDDQLPASATFDGPPTGDEDNFRLEVTGLESGQAIDFDVDASASGWFGLLGSVSGQDAYRSNRHLRLVSNAVDDQHAGDQTGRVAPGDEIVASVFRDGVLLTRSKIQVFRPASEQGRNAIRSATADIAPVAIPGVAGVSVGHRLQLTDAAWMQCAVRIDGTGRPTVEPYQNALYVRGPAMADGILVLQVDGTFLPPTTVTAGESAQTVAASIVNSIRNSNLPAGTTADSFLIDPTSGESWVVVDRGRRDVSFQARNPPMGLDVGGVLANFSLPIDYMGEWLISVNYGDRDPRTMDFFVVPTGHLMSGNRADAWPACLVGNSPQQLNHSFLELRVADGSSDNPHTIAHEAARFILNDCTVNASPPYNLLNTTAVMDRIDANKRLTDLQCNLGRTHPGGPAVLN